MNNTLLFIVSMAVGALIGFMSGVDFGAWKVRREAVEQGIAEYYLDQNFEKQWRWKQIPTK